MKKEDDKEVLITIAYWKGRWVDVPLFYVPDEAIIKNGQIAHFKITSIDGRKIEPIATHVNKAFDKAADSVIETIVPWIWSDKELKKLCQKNDIPFFWVTGRLSRTKIRRSRGINRREVRKIPSLTSKEVRQIRKQLKKTHPVTGLIVGILWYHNNSLVKSGGFVTLEEILRLQMQNISPQNDKGGNCIQLSRPNQFLVYSLPISLWKPLCRLIREDSVFVFANKNGGPLLPSQVDEYIKKAAKIVGFTNPCITSACLRPQFNKMRAERMEKKYYLDVSVRNYLESVEEKEWVRICENIPAIKERRGRKSKHNPMDIFNAILYILRTQCSIRKLPSSFPPWQAVDSQKRRWEKAGIVKKILDFRKITLKS